MMSLTAGDGEGPGFDWWDQIKQIVFGNVGSGVSEVIENLENVSLGSVTVIIQLLLTI